MIGLAAWLSGPALLLGAWLVGRAIAGRVAPGAASSPTAAFASGLVAAHVLLQLLQVVGWSWSGWWLCGLVAVSGASLLLERPATAPRPGSARSEDAVGLGDLLAVVSVASVLWAAVTRRIDSPDFVFHWGVKGRKLALAAGMDWSYLSSPSAWHLHPDYPNLLPELTAWTIRLARSMDAAPQLAWSAVFFAALLLAVREALTALDASRWARQMTLGAVAAAIAGFAFAGELGGSADWLIAWAVVLAIPALALPDAPGAELRLAIAAALAAGSKIEGVPLAVAMLGGFALARRSTGLSSSTLRSLLRTGAPVAAVIVPWLSLCLRHDLFQSTNHGAWSWQRLLAALPELVRGLFDPLWVGLAATVLLLPWLALRRPSRWPAVVLLAQTAFYVAIYATAPVDTALYVRTSWARLLFHLLPAVWVLAAAAVGRDTAQPVELSGAR